MLTLASDPAKIAEVTQFVDSVSKRFALNEDVQANLMISLTEAVNNAIIHGNGMDASKKVTINLRREKNRISVQVSDQGNGFDPNRLPDPTCNEHICECGGRGVFLIKQLCEKVEFANGGSTVRMQFSV